MKIAAVIPALDEAQRIGATIDAVREAGIDEIVIADGGSRDRTLAIAEQRGALVVAAPRGRARQQNAGAAATKADALVFVHADCLLPRDAATWIRCTLADDGVALGAFRTRTRFDGTTHLPPFARLFWLADIRGRFRRAPYGDQALFVRRETFRAAGGFPDLALFEDVAFSRAVAAFGHVRIVPSTVLVSGRRFVAHPIAATLSCHVLPLLYDVGVSPARLAQLWGAVR
jgi:rSAM/selenodomain-associated transferase 2